MTNVTIRTRTPDDDTQIVDIFNRTYPELPPESVAEFRHWMKTRPATARQERWVAEENETIVGHAILSERWAFEHENLYYAFIAVDPQRRRQGIGSQLYDVLHHRAVAVGAERLYAEISEEHREAQEFAMQRGFTFTGHAEQMSRLEVRAASLDGYDGIEERLHREGIHIVTLAAVGTEESFLRAVHAVDLEASRDVPSSEVFTGIPYDVWLKHLSGPGRSPESFWIAMDGDMPIGVATLERRGINAAFNGFTGVAQTHRGRGVARALKLKTIEWSRCNGVDFIYTGNHVDNKRMLDINIRLGYKPLPRFLEVVKEVVKAPPRQRPDLHVATDRVSDLLTFYRVNMPGLEFIGHLEHPSYGCGGRATGPDPYRRAKLAGEDRRREQAMVDEKPIQHQLHDLAHQVMDEIDYANEHLGHAYDALLQFGDRVVGQEHEWANILREKAGKVQAASDILITTAEEVHDPETWDLPAFGDEANMARA